jgi:LacI family transcriptional regulator
VITMKDVAQRAAVSTWVVSKVVNQTWRESRIHKDCAARVADVIRELDFVPNHVARSLRAGRAGAIGLVIPTYDREALSCEYAASLTRGVQSEVSRRQCDLLLLSKSATMTEAEHGLERLRERRIDALIIPGPLGGLRELDTFLTSTAPIVVVFRRFPSPHPAVDVDPAPGITAAVQHLAHLGHRRIQWFAPESKLDAVAGGRLAALSAAAAPLGVEVAVERSDVPGGSDAQTQTMQARQRFAETWQGGRRASAVMCFNDRVAMGVCLAAHDLGVHVPRELSVVGFDDFQGDACIPRLTTISHAMPEIGRRAVALALELAQSLTIRAPSGHTDLLPSRLVVRESTAAPLSDGTHTSTTEDR